MSGAGAGEAAIRARSLAKRFGAVEALRSVDLEVPRGRIYGFLGRNGAGKTTTIRILLGLVRPDSGEVSLLGSSLAADREGLLGRVGYLVEGAAAYPNLTVRENLELQRRLKRQPAAAIGRAIDLLGLEACADRRASRLSLGNKQRLSLARALLGSPELLVLDEPANGLDPAGIAEIRALLRRLANEEGVTVFVSSHLLDEVEQLADRIGIVHEGRLLEELDRGELAARSRVSIELAADEPERAEAILRGRLGFVELSRSGSGLIEIADAGARCPEIARELVAEGIGVERLCSVAEDLETFFMRLTGGAR